MGIRFQCPNGHKLNVKADLAGKRASCPECGAKLIVPGADASPATPPPAVVLRAAAPAGAVWFLQAPNGQQFGPVTDAQFCEWIAAGRIGADSYVWREGWTEWKIARLAAPLLPRPLTAVPVAKPPIAAPVVAAPVATAPATLAPTAAAPAVAASVATSAPAPPPEPVIVAGPTPISDSAAVANIADTVFDENAAPSTNAYALRKQRHKKTQVTVAVVMLLAVLVLAGILIWVIASNSSEAPPEANARTVAQGSERT